MNARDRLRKLVNAAYAVGGWDAVRAIDPKLASRLRRAMRPGELFPFPLHRRKPRIRNRSA